MRAQKKLYQINPIDNLWYEVGSEENKKEIISGLPDEKSKQIAKKLGDHLQLTEDGRVLYPEEPVPGSPLIVLMDWYLRDRTSKPLDADLFKKLVETHLKLPKKWIRN